MSTYKERYEERKKQRESQKSASSYKDRYMARQIESGEFDSNEITSRIDTWFKNHNNYINNYNSRYSTRKGTYEDSYVSDSGEWLDTISAQKSNFDKEASAIMSYLDQYGDYFGKEYTDSVKNAFQSALGQQSEILKQASSDKDFWSQFADENEYLGYQREYKKQKRYEGYAEKYAGKTYEDILAATNKLIGDEEKEWLKNEAVLRYDLNAAQEEIGRLTSILDVKDQITKIKQEESTLKLAIAKGDKNAAEKLAKNNQRLEALNSTWDHALSTYGSEDDLNSLLSSKSMEYTIASRAQKAAELASVADNDPQFSNYSELGKNISYEEVGSTKKQNGATIYDDLKAATLALNEHQLGTELYNESMRTPGEGLSGYFKGLKGLSEYNTENSETVETFRKMNEREFATLAYYLKKDEENGTDLAAQYIDSIRQTLNTRVASDIAEAKEGKLLQQYAFAVGAGIDQFFEGRDAFFSGEDNIIPSATQIASGIIREDLAETGKKVEWLGGVSLGQLGYDALNTTANMLPSMLAGAVTNIALPGAGTAIGAGFLGMSAGGNAKAEMLRLGYSKEQATSYGLLVGIAEAGMEYLLGHIPGLSKGNGLFSTFGTKVASKVDNAISRVAITLGDKGTDILRKAAGRAIGAVGGALDEALEEGLQTIIEPWLKEMATSVDWDAPNVDEVLYSSLLGAITSLGMGGAQNAIQDVITSFVQNAEAKKNYGVGQRELVAKAVEIDPSNKFAQRMQAKADNGKNLTGAQLNRLVKQNNNTLTAQEGNTDTINAEAYGRMVAELDTEDSSATVSEPEKVQQVTGKLPTSKADSRPDTNVGDKVAQMGEVEASKSGKGDIRSVEVNGDRATFTLLNGEKVGLDKVAFKSENERLVANIAVERVSRVKGFTNEAATAMIKGYDGSISPSQYMTAFDEAYEMGATGTPSSKLTGAINSGISERVAFTAYVLGKNTKNAESILNSESKNGIINTNINESEAGYESGENLHLRNSGERVGSQNTQGQISRVESGAGQAESGGENVRIADSEAARLLNEGREVKVADLGILGGSNEQTVRLVDKANETSSMKEARKNAEARGLKVRFFVGDNLVIKDGGGKWISARAYIKGEHVFIRADHPLYTADQLMRHELGHDMIAKGEVDIAAVRERLQKTVGKENIDEVARLYSDAYAGTGMSAEEIWEECICDSLGDMNIFAGAEAIGEFIDLALPEIKAAASETKAPTQTRGSPEGKASRTPLRGRSIEIETMENNRFDRLREFRDDLPNVWYARTYDYFYVYSNRSFTDYTIIKKIKITDANSQLINAIEGALKDEINGDTKTFNDWLKSFRSGKRSHSGNNANASGGRSAGTVDGMDGGARRSEAGNDPSDSNGNSRITGETESKYSSPEEAKASGKVSDAKFSIEFADDIANKQRKYAADGLSRISSEELEKAIADTAHMVNEMKPYANILPQDKVGKTLVKNGSYDVSVENTTVCIRTLAYNSFVDMVSEKVGRPLTQMESFLVSQKLYEIAKEPQCLYCYVSLDRKAFNEMVIRYTEQRDAAISAYEAAGKPEIPKKFNAEWSLFKEFLAGRKPTTNMWDRYTGWINAYNKGERLVSLSDISTEAKRLELVEGGGEIASQVKDILKYAQSASWAKKQTDYVAYYDEILKLKPAVIRNLNNHYGMRWYSFSDNSGAFIVENMQQITDAAIRGLKGLSYTKDTDFAEIFAPTGMNINISVYAKKTESGYEIDAKQSANIEEAIKLREQYPNVGIVVVATDKAGVEWALAQEWSDVVIPFHTVRTGSDVAEFYNWEIFNAEQNDTVSDQNLWDAYTRDVGKKKVSKMVYPSEHQNNRDTYLSICEKRGLTPRFSSFLGNPNYMKLVNETRQSESQTSPLKAVYNLEAADRSFDKFVEKGGYYEGWYNDGIDVDGEADIVAEDVIAGKKANEVDYGRQDINFEDVAKGRKTNRQHGKASMELEFLDFMEQQTNREVLANAFESVAQNDVEKAKLKDYKENIAKLNAEEQKLQKLRGEIKELSFGKGPRDLTKIAQLREEAEKTANRIGIYDKRLLNLEASKPLMEVLKREKQKSYNRAKAEARADFDKYRARAQKSQEELKARYQESKRRGVEGRHKTEVRHKIQGIVSELNTLLLNPTAKKHIKEELRRGVAEALSAFNMDTVGAEERLAEINRKLQKETDPYEIERLLESYRRIQNQGANLQEKLEKLNTAYEKIKDSDDIELNLAYQEVIQNSIKSVSEKVGDTSIRDMTLEQLEMVYDLFKMIRHTIRDANKAFKTKKGETITQMADKVNHEVRTVGGQPYQRNFVNATLQRMGWTFLKPYVAFRTIGSETLVDRYRELREGEDTFYSDIREAQTFIEEQYKKYGFKSWYMKETREFKAKSGKSFELTLEQMMTLYAYSKREQAHAHIMEGGIVFEDALVVKKNKLGVPIKYEVTTKDAFNLSEEIFADIANALTDKQKAYVDAMQAYLSDNMGAKGNEVSMQLVGVKLFKEKFYLPIKSSQYYMNFKSEEAGEVKLRSPAFSKETVKHANNPIVLHNFTDLWAEHINDMAMYHAFVLALEDFTRVYNYKTKTGADTETMDTKATLETAYPGVTKYINKFLKDMNGGVRGETVGWAEKMTSLAKKGSVLGSASVTIQQPSAIMRAMAYINPKYFVGEKVSEGKHKEKWEELKKYAPIAGIKEMGRFDVGMGQSTDDWIKADKNILEKAEEVVSLPPAKMDEVTWLAIWDAVKRETAHNYPKLATGSDAFKTLAGERFTDVISLSQVYDSVFSRSDIMRNKSWIAKSLTAFMAEPMTTLNMLWDSAVQGKRTGSAKGFVATTASTGGAVFAAIFVNSLLKSFVMAMRDDDEDESYAEKYLEHFVGDFKDNLNPLNLIPFVKDILSIFKGYDVERMDMALFSDLKNAIDAFDSDNKTLYEKWSGLIGAVAAFRGVPFKNIERDVRAFINTMFGKREETTLEGMLYAIEKSWSGEQKSKGQQLYEAMLKGDEKHIGRLRARFDSPSDISAAIKEGLRENDTRVKEAAKMLNSGDIRGFADFIDTISGEGIFDGETVEAAIRAEASAFNSKIKDAAEAKRDGKMDDYIKIVKELRESYRGVYTQDEIVEAVNSYTFEDIVEDDVEEVESVYKNSDINAALESGDTETASEIIKELIEVKTENNFLKAQREAEESGKRFKEKEARTSAELEARSSIRSSLTNYWKKRYIAAYESGNEAEINRISELLYSTGIYGNRKKYLDEVLEGWLEK